MSGNLRTRRTVRHSRALGIGSVGLDTLDYALSLSAAPRRADVPPCTDSATSRTQARQMRGEVNAPRGADVPLGVGGEHHRDFA